MIRIAHGMKNLVAKIQAVWLHVFNMCGIITFKGVNVHLIRGIVLVPFDGVRITTFLINIEGPGEQKFLGVVGEERLPSWWWWWWCCFAKRETFSVADQNDLHCRKL